MNIFITDTNPFICARHHCKVHRNKMIVEYAQLMSTAHAEWGTWLEDMYKPTHKNHPSAVWTRASKGNYAWVYKLWLELLVLYEQDTGKKHASSRLIDCLYYATNEQPTFNQELLAMPDEYKQEDVCQSYINYLNSKFKEWLGRAKPMRLEFTHKPAWLSVGQN